MKHSLGRGWSLRRALSLGAATALVTTMLPAGAAAAQDERDTDDLCADAPASSFADVVGSAHEANVACMLHFGLTEGLRGGQSFGPRQDVTRGQMASFVARFIEDYTGEPLPAGAPSRFTDVPASGYAHSANIFALAAIGVVSGTNASGGQEYGPQALVSRAQMASMLRRAMSYLDDGDAATPTAPPASSEDVFADDDGSVHEDNINALAAEGIVQGYQDGTYRPSATVKRDAMASFVMRTYAYAVDADLGGDDPGEPDPEVGSISGVVTEPSTTEQPDDDTFTTVAEDGFLAIGDNDPFDFAACPEGEPAEEDGECIELAGEVAEGGTITIDGDGISFPQLETEASGFPVFVDITAPEGAIGTLDETGAIDLDLALDIAIDVGGVVQCTIDEVELALSTGDDTLGEDGRATLSDDTFAVPAATGADLCSLVNGELGLPSESGENEVEFELLFDFGGEVEVPGDPIEGATVTVAGTELSAVTDEDGAYTITDVEVGTYDVTAAAEGYHPATEEDVTVSADEDTVVDFELEVQLFEAGEFTMFVESGSVVIGVDEDEPYVIDFSQCPDGEPTEEDAECITFSGAIDEDGDFTIEPEGVSFPDLETEALPDVTVFVRTGVSEAVTGNIDPATGDATFDLPMQVEIEIPLLASTCQLDVDLAGVSGDSGDVSGSPLGRDARVSIADGTFAVEETTPIEGDNCGVVDGVVGLPSDAGGNTAVFNLLLGDPVGDPEEPLFEAGEFTMFVESGSVVIGTDEDEPYVIAFSECPDGEPAEEDGECITFSGEIDEDGDFTIEPAGVSFPDLETEAMPGVTVLISTGVSEAVTGTIDPDTGEATFDLPMQVDIEVPALASTCQLVVGLDGTTGDSGEVSGDALGDDGRVSVVDGTFAVDATTPIEGGSCGLVDGVVGLPSPAGENTAVFDLLLTQD